jgi:hypothetical protein
MTLSIVQDNGGIYYGSGTSTVALTLPSNPTAGNVLVGYVTTSDETITPPSGSWQEIFSVADSDAQQIAGCWAYEVQAGDGETWDFTLGYEYAGGYIFEVTGASTTWANWQEASSGSAASAAQASPSVTPDVLGMLGLAFRSMNEYVAYSSVSSGWTAYTGGQSASGKYHGSFAASLNSLTANTTSAESCTFTTTSAPDYGTAATLLIPPAAAAATPGRNLVVAQAVPRSYNY